MNESRIVEEACDFVHTLNASSFFDGSPVPTFVINSQHVVTHFNRACAVTLGVKSEDVIGTRNLGKVFYNQDRPVMADLIVEGMGPDKIEALYQNAHFSSSAYIPEAYEAESFFPNLGPAGRWLYFTAAPLRDASGRVVGAIETLQDITARKQAEAALLASRSELETLVEERTWELARANASLMDDFCQLEQAKSELVARNTQLSELNEKLSRAQEFMVQSEKLASIGQLAAGVAHEINNPIGYVFSNYTSLEGYLDSLFEMLKAYEEEEGASDREPSLARLRALKERIELSYVKEDIPVLMRESKEGIARVRKIVQDLKDFSHSDFSQDWQWSNLTVGIDSTLNIVSNEVKYKANLVKEYGNIPDIECLPSQINQVIMNLVVNAAHAIGPERGTVTVRTGTEGDKVWIEVTDTGSGIPKEHLPRIFDPFFTTKPVGKGTGLGLSLSYGIVQKHNGQIDVTTEVGKGTCFRVTLPVRQTTANSAIEG